MNEIKACFHLPCKHTSGAISDTAGMSTYGDRIAQQLALKRAGGQKTRKGLAQAVGISVQAVGQVVRGETKAFTAENNALAAAYLECDPGWLATGKATKPAFAWMDPQTGERHSPEQFARVHVLSSAAIKKAKGSSQKAPMLSRSDLLEQFGMLLAMVPKARRKMLAGLLSGWAEEAGAESYRMAIEAAITGGGLEKPHGT